jgi:uncharacterized RDD family membrane protein YckC
MSSSGTDSTARSPVDPRTIITPESFAVAPGLIGIPLARPARRATAMLLDLLPLAILVNANALFFAIAAAVLLWRASRSDSRDVSSTDPASSTPKRGRKRKAMLRAAAAFMIFLIVLRLADSINERTSGESDGNGNGDEIDLALRDLATVADLRGLQNATDPSAAQRHARRLAEWVHSKGESEQARQTLARMLIAMVEEEPAAVDALRSQLGEALAPAEAPVTDDSAVIAYARALTRGDAALAARLLPRARSALAGPRILELELETDHLRDEIDAFEAQAEQGEERGPILATIGSVADDLGIGFGWAALYFTAFLALWNGQTPGKRLMGIQVIRLDGQPLGWWISFERFGGYAAAIWTGLLGFLQILWDRNRQGIHDKIAETVVIRMPSRRAAPR